MNANNSPSNTNSNIGFGNCNAVTKYISPRLLDLSMKRQVQSLADDGERNNAGKGAKTTSRPRKNERRRRVGCKAFGNLAIGATGHRVFSGFPAEKQRKE